MRTVELKARSRAKTGKGPARRLRATGRIPAVLYGRDKDAAPVTVDSRELSHIIRDGGGEHVLVNLQIEDGPVELTLLREAQHDPLTGVVKHIDFFRISEDEPVTTQVPLVPIGTSQGQRDGGVYEQHLREIEVECLPRLIPEAIEFDITELNLGDNLHISDITAPEGVKILTSADHPLAAVMVPKIVEEVTETEETEEEAAEGTEGGEKPSEEAKSEES